MFGLFDKITEFFQEIFIGIIQANLEAMFLDINENVSLVATEVGKIPSGWNAEVFSFVKNINDTVVIPIAGIIITAVLCIELINMVMEKNNMHSDTDNLQKMLKDCMTEVGFWNDDAQVVVEHVEKLWSDEPTGIAIEIEVLDKFKEEL